MITRVRFVLAAASALAGIPLVARAEDPASAPSGEPSPAAGSPAPAASAEPARKKAAKPKAEATEPPHVHGANGVVTLPEHRKIEWVIEVLDGPEFRLSAYRGKVVFVNVFATWCGPCQKEQPAVVAFANAHAEDTAVIGVDVKEEDNDVRAYRKKYAIAYPIAMDRYDKRVRGIYREGKMVFPTTVVFKPDGTLSCAWEGTAGREWFEYERKVALGEAT
jgi:thiol-disulfide isomerase/thioredoxin